MGYHYFKQMYEVAARVDCCAMLTCNCLTQHADGFMDEYGYAIPSFWYDYTSDKIMEISRKLNRTCLEFRAQLTDVISKHRLKIRHGQYPNCWFDYEYGGIRGLEAETTEAFFQQIQVAKAIALSILTS